MSVAISHGTPRRMFISACYNIMSPSYKWHAEAFVLYLKFSNRSYFLKLRAYNSKSS